MMNLMMVLAVMVWCLGVALNVLVEKVLDIDSYLVRCVLDMRVFSIIGLACMCQAIYYGYLEIISIL